MMWIALALGVVGLAACVKGSPAQVVTSTIDSTVTNTPTSAPTTPVNVGPTTTKVVGACPLVGSTEVAGDVGQRLAEVTAQSADGKVVGCTWYPLAHADAECGESCFQGEHLPPGTQADVKISSYLYDSTLAANNAFIRLAEQGAEDEREQIAANNTGLCFRTTFWAPDASQDWACTFAVGTRVVLINTVVTGDSSDVVTLARAVASRF